jgi:hypothetical protein
LDLNESSKDADAEPDVFLLLAGYSLTPVGAPAASGRHVTRAG